MKRPRNLLVQPGLPNDNDNDDDNSAHGWGQAVGVPFVVAAVERLAALVGAEPGGEGAAGVGEHLHLRVPGAAQGEGGAHPRPVVP